METKFKAGELVFERIRPGSKLIVSRFDFGIYYCKVFGYPLRKELVYMERDLQALPS